MTIPSEILSQIWDQLESLHPSYTHPPELWSWYFKNYYYEVEPTVDFNIYWKDVATHMLLTLASEGEDIL